jgi:hypothetical protein
MPVRSAVTFIAALGIIAAGLGLRTYGYALGLPFIAVKYGGSALWAAMVYCLIASFAPARPPRHIALAAITVAVSVEFFRLVHTPGLDAFRLTPAGALLLGRIFSPKGAHHQRLHIGRSINKLNGQQRSACISVA